MSITDQLNDCLYGKAECRGEAFHQLMRQVKLIDETGNQEELQVVTDELHHLVPYLLIHEDNLNGCTISIIRRGDLSPRAIEELADHAQIHHNQEVIEALGLVTSEQFSLSVERIIRSSLNHSNTQYAAAAALYQHADDISELDTIKIIADKLQALLGAKERLCRDHLLLALALNTKRKFGSTSIHCLENALDACDPESKKEIIDVIRWTRPDGNLV